MTITFVQDKPEFDQAIKVIDSRLSRRRAKKKGAWIIPPARSTDGDQFIAVSSPDGKSVYVESFGTLDGALAFALGIHDVTAESPEWDRAGYIKERGDFK